MDYCFCKMAVFSLTAYSIKLRKFIFSDSVVLSLLEHFEETIVLPHDSRLVGVPAISPIARFLLMLLTTFCRRVSPDVDFPLLFHFPTIFVIVFIHLYYIPETYILNSIYTSMSTSFLL